MGMTFASAGWLLERRDKTCSRENAHTYKLTMRSSHFAFNPTSRNCGLTGLH